MLVVAAEDDININIENANKDGRRQCLGHTWVCHFGRGHWTWGSYIHHENLQWSVTETGLVYDRRR